MPEDTVNGVHDACAKMFLLEHVGRGLVGGIQPVELGFVERILDVGFSQVLKDVVQVDALAQIPVSIDLVFNETVSSRCTDWA